MNPQEITVASIAAIDAIPHNAKTASKRADACTREAGTLQRILKSSELSKLEADYEAHGDTAATKQKRYKYPARTAALLTFAAAVLGGCALYFDKGGDANTLRHNFIIAQALCAFASAAIGAWLLIARPHDKWRRARADAEKSRLQHFEFVFKQPEKAQSGELPPLPLKLEYMRRFLMDDQKGWYESRAGNFWWANVRHNAVRLIAGLCFVTLAVPVLARLIDIPQLDGFFRLLGIFETWRIALQQEKLFSLVGLIGTSAFTLVATFAIVAMSMRNARRYREMQRYLTDISATPLQQARLAAATSNDDESAYGFWRLVHDELDVEHREWHGVADVTANSTLKDLLHQKLPRFKD